MDQSPETTRSEAPLADAHPVDLRSDTVTLPTQAMYDRMLAAPLGDDGLDGDPTVRQLEDAAARMLGKEAGLFVPTATMGNLIAVLSHTSRQGQVAMEASSHMYMSERAGATFGGIAYVGIPGVAGAMDLGVLEDALQRPGALRTELVCMETSHANAGGAVLPLDHMQSVWSAAQAAGAHVHLDGARLFNAAVALGVQPDAIARYTDTTVICLSKGLSAPAGSVIVGSTATIRGAKKLRKMLGGTQRQIGVVAAAGLVALQSQVARLAHDHAQAQRLGDGLRRIDQQFRVNVPATNILIAELPATAPDSSVWVQVLAKGGLLVRPNGARRLRMVTHRHLSAAAIDLAIERFQRLVPALLGKA